MSPYTPSVTVVVVLALLAACLVAAAYFARRAREDGATERLRVAIAELQASVGAELLPVVERLAVSLDAWLAEVRPSRSQRRRGRR